MAITNFTEDGKQISLDRLQCSVDLTSDMQYHLTVVLVLNIFTSITAFLGNTLILVALSPVPELSFIYPPPYRG